MAHNRLEDILPLSPMQEGMLFHSLLDPGSGVDFEQLLYRIDGPLELAVLRAAWQAVLDRHSALRARFVSQGVDRPLQLIERSAAVRLTELDWTGLDDYQPELASWLAEDRAAGFELTEAPLLRIAVFRLAGGRSLMVLSFHHLLLDGWSVRLVLRDLRACYRAELTGRDPELPPAPQYRDYLRWLHDCDHDAAQAYWRAELADFSTSTQILDGRRTGESGYATEQIEFDRADSDRLRQFARSQRVTVNTLVQGAWALLLARYSGTADVVFGATMSTRPAELAQVEEMVGLMINTLPVRIRVPARDRVGDWLRAVQQSQLELRRYDFTPLVQAQASSAVPAGSTLFQSLLVFENYPNNAELSSSDDDLNILPVGAQERNGYPLSVVAAVRDQLLLEITYDRSYFGAERIGRLAGHLRTLLNELASDPQALLGELTMLPTAERELIVTGWNNTAADYPADRCVHELFEDRVAERPDALAVTDLDGSRLSYRQLNERANRLAHRLRELGAGPERVVGICADASAAGLVGLLGILKSGAAYLPLDPAHPGQRLAMLIEDAQAGIVVVEPSVVAALPADLPSERLVLLDPDEPAVRAMPESNPAPLASPANLAYVMFTSGSTGRPKGVLVHHRGLVNYLWWAIEGYGLAGAAGAPMFGSLAVDLSMPNYFLPLIGGKSVTVLPTERSLDPVRRRLLQDDDFSLLKITPGHLDVLRHSLAGRFVDSVRTYVIGADEVKPETIATWQKIAPTSRLINEYGPTETVVGCSTYLADDDFDPTVPVPIGRPIANIRMYVLDEWLNPVPAGVLGELFIGGEGVARGYLNRPGITAEKFVPDPFGQPAGGRLYRTGDLARFRPDGNLEFLGRTDHQVKIRGYRVELGEVEARLLALDPIAEAVVVAREDVPGDRRLVAYLVASDERPSVPELRDWVAATLPPHMVPAVFQYLPALPLSGNGKVDRGALPAPDSARPELATGPTPPRTELERLIAGIWCEVLGLDEVGVTDSFFDLGGHSLLATQVMSRLGGLGRGEVPLRVLFAEPTVAGLAAYLGGNDAEVSRQAILRADRSRPLPLSFGQQRLWFLDQLDPGSTEFVVPIAWRLTGPLDIPALRSALAAVVSRHEVLRTTFGPVRGDVCQRIADELPVSLPVVEATEDTASAVLAELAGQPFDLTAGPLWRAVLVRQGPQDHVLLFSTHHIAMDAWSVQNLVRELSEYYCALLAGKQARPAPLALQYADYAAWQRGWLADHVLDRQLAYWRRQLADVPPLELPTDRPRPLRRSTDGAVVDFTVPPNIVGQLHQVARSYRVTPFMVLLAALQALLGRHAGQDDVVVGTPIANRNRTETEDLIGFFVNTLVLRTDLSGNPDFGQLLHRVREVTLGAYENQDLPFERLVEELRPERDLSRTPLFSVLLVVNNAPPAGWQLPGVRVVDHPVSTGHAKYDLTLALADTEDGLQGSIRYSAALFDAERVERLASQFCQLLAAALDNPRSPLSELPLVTGAELSRLLDQGRLAAAADPGQAGLHRLVEAQAAATPNAPALVGPDGAELSYHELNARANQLAHHLLDLGDTERIGPETLVGLYAHRSVPAVIGLLAVLKAGAGYLPLNPDHPVQRTAQLLGDTGTRVVLTVDPDAGALAGCFVGRILNLDTTELADYPTENPAVEVHPACVAYVVHTSGSTGVPKGVTGTHGAARVRLRQLLADYPLGPGDAVAALAELGFDASVREIFTTLGSGARLLVTEPRTAQEPAAVLAAVAEHRVTALLSTVPSMLYQLAAEPVVPADLSQLRLVLCGGERLQPERLAGSWLAGRVVNQFGPTEATLTATRAAVPAAAEPAWAYDVGRPVAGSSCYLLDAGLQPCPPGMPGELYLAGPALTRGYWGQPALTAERFLPDPFAGPAEAGGRLYRTGDLCRWSPEGTLEHQGRTDGQVKIRGFRVELEEIRSRLLRIDGVFDAVVVLRPTPAGDHQLVAYLVGADQPSGTTRLRASLAEVLPDYLIPAAFVWLPDFPRTSNGKIDRGRLPEPDAARPNLEPAFVAPRTETEALIAQLWCSVLGKQQVGVFDNFFDLGGHSLLGAHVVAQLRSHGFPGLSLRAIFARPTVAELAEQLTGGSVAAEPESGGLVALNDSSAERTLFCVHEGTGSITGYYELARLLEPDLRVVGIAFDDDLLQVRAEDQLSALASAYVRLLRARQPTGPYLLLGWSMGGLVAFEMAAQLRRAGHRVDRVCLVDSVVLAPETRIRDEVDRLLDELLQLSGDIAEQDWSALAADRLTEHMRKLDLREEQIALGKQALETVLRRNQFFRAAKRNYRPQPADMPMTVIKAEEGNWRWSWFEAWHDYASDLELAEVPGTHLSVMERPQLDQVVELIRPRLLDRAEPASAGRSGASRQ